MEDEKGMDEKIFVVPEDEIDTYNQLDHESKSAIIDKIIWFFSNYKSRDGVVRWSRVHRVVDEWNAAKIYEESVERWNLKLTASSNSAISFV